MTVPTAVSPVTAATQELRIAATMTGGVSLAIWMGGASREVNLLDQASRMREQASAGPAAGSPLDAAVRDVYRRLLDLLDVTVRVDVLSGTSAGGINAALLGLCHARGVDLGMLRDIWLDAGAFDKLLRDPAKPKPTSLLQGDGVLLSTLHNGILRLAHQEPLPGGQPAGARPTTVFVTTTLLSGETSRFTDSYGTVVPDVDHHGLFRFDEGDLAGAGDGADPDAALPAIALAARSSASFPMAFEPAFLPFDSPAADAAEGPAVRPAMQQYANLTRPHWVADGGLLANRPIGPLLETIFERRSEERQVRRVLLFVVPDPGGTPDPRQSPPAERMDRPPTMGQALLRDLAATQSQSISGELAAIRRHNDRVDALGDVHLTLAELALRLRATGDDRPLTSDAGWSDYRTRAGLSYVRPAVDQFHREITSRDADQLPPAWADAIRPGAAQATGESLEAGFRRAAAEAVTATWQRPDGTPPWTALGSCGLPAFDGAKAIVLAMLRRAYATGPDRDTRAALGKVGARVHGVLAQPAAVRPEPIIAGVLTDAVRSAGWTPDRAAAEVGTRYDAQRSAGLDLAAGWRGLAEAVVDHLDLLRALAPAAPVAPGAPGGPAATSAATAGGSAADGPQSPEGQDAPNATETPDLHDASGLSVTRRRGAAAAELRTFLDFLAGRGAAPTAEPVARRLFDLHVATRAILPVDAEIDQPVELIQVSANTRSRLAPDRSTAAGKLTGTQMHHFGAFYKGSWRANDWMWGRLDGTGWLVHMLLDPRRLRTVAETVGFGPGPLPQHRADLLAALAGVAGPLPGDPQVRADIDAELAFLDHADAPLPPSLPATSMWVAAAAQRYVAAAELPVVARQMVADPRVVLSARERGWLADVADWVRRDEQWRALRPAVVRASADAAATTAAAGAAVTPAGAAGTSSLFAQAEAAAAAVARQVAGEWVAGMAPGLARAAAGAAVDVLTPMLGTQPSADDVARASAASAASAGLALAVPERELLDQVAALLRTCPVPDEKLNAQVGQPLLTQTVAKTLAVASAATGDGRKAPKAARPAVSAMRTVTMTGYRAVGVTGGRTRLLLLAGAAVTALGAILSFQHSVLWGLSGLVALLVGLYLLTLAAWGMGRRAVAGLVTATGIAALVALLTPSFRTWLVGTGGGSNPNGWVGRVMLPWVRSSWWSMLIVVGGVVVIVLALSMISGIVQGQGRDRAARRPPPAGGSPAARSAAGAVDRPDDRPGPGSPGRG